jgi:hypothetical protein
LNVCKLMTTCAEQAFLGITSDTPEVRDAITAALTAVLPTGSVVTITSVTPTGRRERSRDRRALLATGVIVEYTVELINPPKDVTVSTITSTLQSSTTASAMKASLEDALGVTITVQPPQIVDLSPSRSPTLAPTSVPVAAGLSAGGIAGVVIAGVIVLALTVFGVYMIVSKGGSSKLSWGNRHKARIYMDDKANDAGPAEAQTQARRLSNMDILEIGGGGDASASASGGGGGRDIGHSAVNDLSDTELVSDRIKKKSRKKKKKNKMSNKKSGVGAAADSGSNMGKVQVTTGRDATMPTALI